MNDITVVAADSTDNYFDYLSSYGYRKDQDSFKILALQYIEEMFAGRLSMYISEADYRLIDSALYCLFGKSCLIPYPQYKINPKVLDYAIMDYNARLTQGDDLRSSEDGYTRIQKQ